LTSLARDPVEHRRLAVRQDVSPLAELVPRVSLPRGLPLLPRVVVPAGVPERGGER
jgi:hypothetical protein